MANFISEAKINEIKEQSRILEVASEYVTLKKVGRNYQGLCPFHSEKTPSFTVNEEKGIFHCFGCGAGGNVFTFLMKAANLSFPEAARQLAKKAGVEIPRERRNEAERQNQQEKEKFFQVNKLASDYFQHILLSSPEGERALKYLRDRGLNKDLILQYHLGYAPDSWNKLLVWLNKRKIPLSRAERVGLIVSSLKKKGDYYDYFRGRITFPIFDLQGRILGFGGRILGKGQPKYLNSPESPVYQKSKSLYGLYQARESIQRENVVLLVEGYFDLLVLHRHKLINSVATLGTALTREHIDILKRYTKDFILLFDADEGGKKAAQRSLGLFLDKELSARAVVLEQGYDPDSYLREFGAERLMKKVKEAPLLIDLFIEETARDFGSSVPGKVAAVDKLAPIITGIKNLIERDLYIKKIAEMLGLKEDAVRNSLKRPRGESVEKYKNKKFADSAPRGAEEVLLQLMLEFPSLIDRVREEEVIELFHDPIFRKIGIKLLEEHETVGEIEPTKIIDLLEDEQAQGILSQLYLREADFNRENFERVFQDCILKIKLDHLDLQKKNLLTGIKEAEKKRDDSLSKNLSLKWQEVISLQKKLRKEGISS
ncbi:MAG: DNA primase [Deltaproteobacteria bacterium]|nr:MAG: DNA primase [Deltaproteobacteria bacterium]